MCGIAGLVDLEGVSPEDRARVLRMRDTPVHRGPDDARLFANAQAGLGHGRLSIVDLAGGALRERALPELLSMRSLAGDQTLFDRISTLMPGHLLSFAGGRASLRRYWSIPRPSQANATPAEDMRVIAGLMAPMIPRATRQVSPIATAPAAAEERGA